MKSVLFLFPHQLFEESALIGQCDEVILIEEFLFFRQFQFHKMKLYFHRVTMRRFFESLKIKDVKVSYISSGDAGSDVRDVGYFERYRAYQWVLIDPVDDWLKRRLLRVIGVLGVDVEWHESPNFIQTQVENAEFQRGRKRYFQTDYYQYFRKKRGVLLGDDGDFRGGKLSFDADNRKRLPKDFPVPYVKFFEPNDFHQEAYDYVLLKFGNNPGSLQMVESGRNYATSRQEVMLWFDLFLKERFADFGPYEDAISFGSGDDFLFHSGLSLYMNVGLISPEYVIKRAEEFGLSNHVPLASIEGFVRQVLGWREFVRHVYGDKGRYQRTRNFWGFTRKIPNGFYSGETGILPVDLAIKKVLRTGYNHHIERLMLLGNFMLLCEFDPDEVYRWFMEMYVDAYDWVMVPNVYGMIAFADGGLMTTKPYISGSNYLMKMGWFKKGEDWQQIWDALFWRFMVKHRQVFEGNMRMRMLLSNWDSRDEQVKREILDKAEGYLESLG